MYTSQFGPRSPSLSRGVTWPGDGHGGHVRELESSLLPPGDEKESELYELYSKQYSEVKEFYLSDFTFEELISRIQTTLKQKAAVSVYGMEITHV